MSTPPIRPRILVIDDEEPIRRLFARFLDKRGYDVLCVAGAAEGLAAFREEPADLVITDLLMPGMNGLELIRHLHRHTPDLPIFAMSGGADAVGESDLVRAAESGAVFVFAKPLRLEEIADLIRIQLEDHPTTAR